MRTSWLLLAVAMAGVYVAMLAMPTAEASRLTRWGARGHEMAARAAVSTLSDDMPAFFRRAGDQLVYLDPEPDRWRTEERAEMRAAWAPDHFVNLEDMPAEALAATDRYGFNDAGILGHFVTDGAQPHHTTIHYNGWSAGQSNPERFTRDRTFHGRFETAFVDAQVEQGDIVRRMERPRSVAGIAREAVFEYVHETHALVDELYRLDRDVGFDPRGPRRSETVDFAAERLAAGARMLASLWLSAWEESQ